MVTEYHGCITKGYLYNIAIDNVKSQKIISFGSRISKNIQNKILTEKEIKTEEDVKIIKSIIDKAEENNSLDELQTYLENEALANRVPPQILFTLSIVYSRKGLVKEEFQLIEKLEQKVKTMPQIAFNLTLVYGRKDILKSQITQAEKKALSLTHSSINFISKPVGASVIINGTEKGITPLHIDNIAEGYYTIKISKDNYVDFVKNVRCRFWKRSYNQYGTGNITE